MTFQQELTDLIAKWNAQVDVDNPEKILISFIDMFNQHFVIETNKYIELMELQLADIANKLKIELAKKK
jgi:hypothetical protein